MDLRNLSEDLNAHERCEARRTMIESELGIDLSALNVDSTKIGHAEEKNCEQMFGHVPIPVGIAGPLTVNFSSNESENIYLPLATTEGALVASTNRGCKALTQSGGVKIVKSEYKGMSRSIAIKCQVPSAKFQTIIEEKSENWKAVGESTSNHLKILNYTIDQSDPYLFITINGDTDEAMGMNMITIAAQAIGNWIQENVDGCTLITVAGNVDSDKKPSARTRDLGRGYSITASCMIPKQIIHDILKTTPEDLLEVAKAKLDHGSEVAGALSPNLHAANIVAALYLATGQDAAHTAEGSLTKTNVKEDGDGILIEILSPAILIGIRGGGTALPAQSQALGLLLNPDTKLHPCKQLAESIAAGILAGEVSLLAAQASQSLASSHEKLGR